MRKKRTLKAFFTVTLTTVCYRNMKQQRTSIFISHRKGAGVGCWHRSPCPKNVICAEELARLWGWGCRVQQWAR